MSKVRVVLMDGDEEYLAPLIRLFVNNFGDKVELHLVTQGMPELRRVLREHGTVDIMAVSADLYSPELAGYDIEQILVLTSAYIDPAKAGNLADSIIYKFDTPQVVFEAICERTEALIALQEDLLPVQIILVGAAAGGAGKTTVAMALAQKLAATEQRVLFCGVDTWQTYKVMLPQDAKKIPAPTKMQRKKAEGLYDVLRDTLVDKDGYKLLLPFNTADALTDMEWCALLRGAKRSGEYDAIIVDTGVWPVREAALLSCTDRIVLVAGESDYEQEKLDALDQMHAFPQGINTLLVYNKCDEIPAGGKTRISPVFAVPAVQKAEALCDVPAMAELAQALQ